MAARLGERGQPPIVDVGWDCPQRLRKCGATAHQARVYNYWLGGKDNHEADRKAGGAAIEAYPDLVVGVRAQRAFLARVVRFSA